MLAELFHREIGLEKPQGLPHRLFTRQISHLGLNKDREIQTNQAEILCIDVEKEVQFHKAQLITHYHRADCCFLAMLIVLYHFSIWTRSKLPAHRYSTSDTSGLIFFSRFKLHHKNCTVVQSPVRSGIHSTLVYFTSYYGSLFRLRRHICQRKFGLHCQSLVHIQLPPLLTKRHTLGMPQVSRLWTRSISRNPCSQPHSLQLPACTIW